MTHPVRHARRRTMPRMTVQVRRHHRLRRRRRRRQRSHRAHRPRRADENTTSGVIERVAVLLHAAAGVVPAATHVGATQHEEHKDEHTERSARQHVETVEQVVLQMQLERSRHRQRRARPRDQEQ